MFECKADWKKDLTELGFYAVVDGKIDGFKVISLPKNSIASEVGIEKDDVIKEINGVRLNDLSALVLLYSRISVEERYEVLIERDKKLIRQVYILK